MNLRVLAAAAGLLGGACWVVRWVAGEGAAWSDAASWTGLALIGVALAVVGAGLVNRSAVWLRVIVAIAFPLLVWSVLSVLRGAGDGRVLDGVVGVLAILLALVDLVRSRSGGDGDGPRRPRAGSHAA